VTYGNLSGSFNFFNWASMDWTLSTSIIDGQVAETPGVFEPIDTGIARTNIQVVNLKNTQMDAFTIVESSDEVMFIASGDHDDPNNASFFDQWNHWPVNVHHSFGELALNDSSASHSPIGNIYNWPSYEQGNNFASKVLLTGISDLSNAELADLAKSWDTPPTIIVTSGGVSQGFDKAQRAFVINATKQTIEFSVEASPAAPIFKPGVVIKHWDSDAPAVVKIDGIIKTNGVDYQQGIILDTDGSETLILWFNQISKKNLTIFVSAQIN
jgi:hypothetical protein